MRIMNQVGKTAVQTAQGMDRVGRVRAFSLRTSFSSSAPAATGALRDRHSAMRAREERHRREWGTAMWDDREDPFSWRARGGERV